MRIAVVVKGQRCLYKPEDFRSRWPALMFIGDRLHHAQYGLELHRSATGPGQYVRSSWGIATLTEAMDLGWIVPADSIETLPDHRERKGAQ